LHPNGHPSRSIVVCSLEPWGPVRRRMQLLVLELLKMDETIEILYITPALDPLYAMLRRRWTDLGPRSPKPGVARLQVYRPRKWLPRRLGDFTDASLARQVSRRVRRLGLRSPLLWINDATYARLVAESGWPSLYDVTDDWLLAEFSSRERERLTIADRELIERCDEVVVCSPELARTRGATRAVELVPNAVDLDRYCLDYPRPRDLPESPVLLYVGTLQASRLDVELCCEIAGSLPKAHLVFVGPNSMAPEPSRKLSSYENVHLLGARRFEDIPGYFQHADLLVVPHRVTAFTESLDPIKAYECAASGRPTLATPLAGFRNLGPPAMTAERADFVSHLRMLLAEHASAPSPRLEGGGGNAPRDEVLRRSDLPTWTLRASQMAEIMERARASAQARGGYGR
jgi:teichuronic acid biosynthesis glycosyltransferase TuaH